MRRTVILCAAIGLLAAGCNPAGFGGDPKDALEKAVRNLADSPGLTITMRLDSSVESLQAMSASEGEKMPAEDAEKILSSSLTISSSNEEDPAKARAMIALDLAGIEDAVEMRAIGTSLFARADVRGIMRAFGEDPAQLQVLSQQARSFGVSFIAPLLRGRWIELEGLQELTQQFGAPSSPATRNEEAMDRLAEEIAGSTQVRRGSEEGPGDHVIAKINLRRLFESIISTARELGQVFPPAATTDVPNENIEVDAWIQGERLRQVGFDLLQFARIDGEKVPAGVDDFDLVATIDEFDGDVEVPDGAVSVNVLELVNLFMGAAFQGSTAAPPQPVVPPGGSKEFCSQLKGAPKSLVKTFEKECPGLSP